MKFLKLFEAFKDNLNPDKGKDHNIFEIDDEWVLKTPKMPGRLTKEQKKRKNLYGAQARLNHFKNHINIMMKYPEIFPKAKMLDKARAAVERLDTSRIDEELEYIFSLQLFGASAHKIPLMLRDMYYTDGFYKFEQYVKDNQDDHICTKWFDFVSRLRQCNIEKKEGLGFIDLCEQNIGEDKNGVIKLLDF